MIPRSVGRGRPRPRCFGSCGKLCVCECDKPWVSGFTSKTATAPCGRLESGVEVDTQSRPFSMPSFELKALIPREYMLYKVSKTPTIIFRLDTTPECCTRVTPHFLRNTLKHTKAASRSARRANHTTRRTSACRSRSVRADRAQKHALATTSKRTVAAAVHVAVHEVDPQRHHEISVHPKKGGPFGPTAAARARAHAARMLLSMPALDSAYT